MTTRLSHSAIEKYNTCSEMYKLHYLDRIRPTTVTSALFFGGCIDEALNVSLLKKKKSLTEEEQELVKQNPFDIFDKYFTTQRINGEDVLVGKSKRVKYFKSDFQEDILHAEDIKNIVEYSKELDLISVNSVSYLKFYDECSQLLRAKQSLVGDELLLYNYISWNSLRRKGHMLIDQYTNEIIPQIEEVHSIQRKVELPDEEGNLLTGIIDIDATLVDKGRFIIDNKTSSRPYKEVDLTESQQLSIYTEYADTNKAAYIVMIKKLRKKEPRVKIQLLTGIIPEETYEKVFDKISDTLYNIKEEKFEKNYDSCFQYGNKCPYYDLCRKGNMTNLVKLENK